MSISTPAFLFLFAWNVIFHPLTLSLCMSLGLNRVSGRQHVYESYFCVHTPSLCLFVGPLNPFTFKVIVDLYVPVAILLVVLSLYFRYF